MNKSFPFPAYFEDKIQEAMSFPDPDPDYVENLLQRIQQPARQPQEKKHASLRLSFVLPTMVAFLLTLSVFIIGPQKVYAAIRAWLGGYIPGIGYVDTGTPIRGIAQPISITVQGVKVTILDVVADSEKTILIYSVDDSQSTEEQSEAADDMAFMFAHDFVSHAIRLPNGESLFEGGDSCGPDTDQPYDAEGLPRFKAVDPAIPPDVDSFTFALLYHPIEITVILVPYTGDAVLPVLVVTEEAAQGTPTPVMKSAPQSNIQFGIDSYVALDDGYILIGYRTWQLEDGQTVVPFYMNESIQVTDANNLPVAYEQIPSIKGYLPEQTDPQREVWGIKITGKEHAWPLTITHHPVVELPSEEVATFRVDLGTDPQVEQTWELGLDVPIEGIGILHVDTLRLFQGTAPVEDPSRYGLDFSIDSADNPGFMVTFADKDFSTSYLGGGGGPEGYNVMILYESGYIPSGSHTIAVLYKPIEDDRVLQVNWQP